MAVLIRSHLHFIPIKHNAKYSSLEWHGIRIFGKSTSYSLLCVYRKQEISMNVFLEEMSHLLLSYCPKTTDEVVVLGDFNVHFGEDANSVHLSNLLHQWGLFQMVNEPTCISGYTLDLIFSNLYSLPLVTEVSKELIESTNPQIKFDHFPIFFSLYDEF